MTSMQTMEDIDFERLMTALIGYLRPQKTLICKMEAKRPYWVNVRWKSMSKVLTWML